MAHRPGQSTRAPERSAHATTASRRLSKGRKRTRTPPDPVKPGARAAPKGGAAFPVLGLTALPVLTQSGTFGAIGALPPWLATLPRYLPALPVIDAVTQMLRHTSGCPPPIRPPGAATLAAWAVADLLVSARFFRWNPRRPAMPAAPIQPRDSIPPAQRLVTQTGSQQSTTYLKTVGMAGFELAASCSQTSSSLWPDGASCRS